MKEAELKQFIIKNAFITNHSHCQSWGMPCEQDVKVMYKGKMYTVPITTYFDLNDEIINKLIEAIRGVNESE